VYRAEMIFDPLDPIGNIQFDSEAALSIKVSHTYSFRNFEPEAAPQPSSASAPAALIIDTVSVQYGWISFMLKIFVDNTVRSATRKVLDNMRDIIQHRCAASVDSGTQQLPHS
jgi:hypothetical protein